MRFCIGAIVRMVARAVPAVFVFASCSSSRVSGTQFDHMDAAGPSDASRSDAPTISSSSGMDGPSLVAPDAMPPAGSFCALAGSVVWTGQEPTIVPGAGTPGPDLTWLQVPDGFCVHYFATVKMTRQLRFAPDGDLFVASPTTATTGGANNGIAGIVILPDDDHDGTADSNITFLDNLPSTQGLMFAGRYFYYQDGAAIRRVPFAPGDRQPSAPSEIVTRMDNWPQDALHWPKVLDMAQDGAIYISNGSTQGEACTSTRPLFGAVFRLGSDGSTADVAKGFRNPIAMRCEADHNVCLVTELALDYSANAGGREKLIAVRPGDDWGYPCCATHNVPYAGVTYQDNGRTPDCSGVTQETDSFIIGHTPFGLDFETGRWPARWANRVFVTLHGDFGTWRGARIVAIALDPATGIPVPATELNGGSGASASIQDLATGWDNGKQDHGRPAAVVFAPDGRLFVGDDQLGAVVWIAPVGLMRP